ncbi:MAG: hypothetical protein IPJ20_17815 [Flammeovirgaceae bacterium]|jgi:hypothetical protein|nr:hypothetical protein [Flammeovirgaceae bacterium]
MKNIEFKSDSAQRIYNDYLYRVKSTTSILSVADQTDLLLEINSHIYEAMQTVSSTNEVESLLTITEKLGRPEEFLVPMVAARKIVEAQRTFNPRHVLQALRLNISNGIFYALMSFLYLFLSVFLLLILSKLFAPQRTGMFMLDGKFKAFGFVSDTNQMTEVLGYWFIPITLGVALLFYVTLTLLFRLKTKTQN